MALEQINVKMGMSPAMGLFLSNCCCVSVSSSSVAGTCSDSFAHFHSSGLAVPPQEPTGIPWQPEAFQLPGGQTDAGEAVRIWAEGTQIWPDIQKIQRENNGPLG